MMWGNINDLTNYNRNVMNGHMYFLSHHWFILVEWSFMECLHPVRNNHGLNLFQSILIHQHRIRRIHYHLMVQQQMLIIKQLIHLLEWPMEILHLECLNKQQQQQQFHWPLKIPCIEIINLLHFFVYPFDNHLLTFIYSF